MILEQHSSAIVKRHEKFGKHRSAFPIVLSIHYIVSNKHQNFVQSSIVNRITNELDFQVCFRFVAFYCRSKPAARTSGFHWTDCVFRNIIQCFLTTCKDTYFIRNKRNHYTLQKQNFCNLQYGTWEWCYEICISCYCVIYLFVIAIGIANKTSMHYAFVTCWTCVLYRQFWKTSNSKCSVFRQPSWVVNSNWRQPMTKLPYTHIGERAALVTPPETNEHQTSDLYFEKFSKYTRFQCSNLVCKCAWSLYLHEYVVFSFYYRVFSYFIGISKNTWRHNID